MFGKKKKTAQQPTVNTDQMINMLQSTLNQQGGFQQHQQPYGNAPFNQGGFPPFQGQGQSPTFDLTGSNPQMGQQPSYGGNQQFGGFQNQSHQAPTNQFHIGDQGQQGFSQPQMPNMNQQPPISQFGFPPQMEQPTKQGHDDFGFNPMQDFQQNTQQIDERINFVHSGFEQDEGLQTTPTFSVSEPKTLQEAKKVIFELRERVHYLEATLTTLQTNYDNERKLGKKQSNTMEGHTKKIVDVIQAIMQTQKYKYEKDNGSMTDLSFDELIQFLTVNTKELLGTEKQKNAKLFSLLKEMEEKNKRLEAQLLHSTNSPMGSNPGGVPNGFAQPSASANENVHTNITNIDKINDILGGQKQPSQSHVSPNANFSQPNNFTPNSQTPQPNTATMNNQSAAQNSKLAEMQKEIQTFNTSVNDVSLHQTEEAILKTLGETGIDNNDAMVQNLEPMRKNVSMNSFKTMLYNYRKKMIEKGLIESEILELPMKGYSKVELFRLSDKGKLLYQQISGRPPVETYMLKRVHQHSSYEHSFVIDKMAEYLELNKYQVITDEKQLRHPVEVSGQQYHVEFDLIAEKDGQKYYIEVEMGTTAQKDFQDKMDKNYAFSKLNGNPIVVMSPSKKSAETNLNKVNNWMKSRGGYKQLHQEKQLKILLPFFEEVKSNRWLDKLELFVDLTK